MKYYKLNLGLRWKKVIEMTPKDIGSLDPAEAEQYYLKVKMKCTHEQYKMFKKSVACTKWTAKGVVFTLHFSAEYHSCIFRIESVNTPTNNFRRGTRKSCSRQNHLEVREAYEE